MPKFSILTRVQAPDTGRLQAMIDSLVAQTEPDWELWLVGTPVDLIGWLDQADARVRIAHAPAGEPLPYSINRLLPALGDWVAELGQDDRLLPGALAAVSQALLLAPDTRVAYTDEECRNWFGQISMRSRKGAFNPMRLRHQAYLRGLTVTRQDTLVQLGGFDPITSTHPEHDLQLRVLDVHGRGAFTYVPERLYQRFRDHRHGLPRVDHDLEAIRQHLTRRQIPATVHHLNGRPVIDYAYRTQPWVTVLVIVGDDELEGLRRIRRSQVGPLYQPATFKVLHVGTSDAARRAYEPVCSSLRLAYAQTSRPLPIALNQVAGHCDTELLLFLQGEAVHPRWLHRLVDHSRGAQVGAVGARCFAGSRLHQPGTVGYQYDGWDWNTAGRYDVLTCPHEIATVSSACLLLPTRLFLQFGFRAEFPTLYAMDLCLRLDQAGYSNILVPRSRIEVTQTAVPSDEASLLGSAWPAWNDRFGLHQALQQ